MAFTTLDLLATVVAALFSANAGALYQLLYQLTIDNACAGLGITPEAYPQALSDGRVEVLPDAVYAPLPKVVIDGSLLAQALIYWFTVNNEVSKGLMDVCLPLDSML